MKDAGKEFRKLSLSRCSQEQSYDKSRQSEKKKSDMKDQDLSPCLCDLNRDMILDFPELK